MLKAILYLLAGGAVLAAIGAWRRHQQQDPAMSGAWLKSRERLEQRVEFHGVSIRFPIQKAVNESPLHVVDRFRKRVGSR